MRSVSVYPSPIQSIAAETLKVQEKLAKDTSDHYETLKVLLHKLDQPIIHIADHMSGFQDRLNREFGAIAVSWQSSSFRLRGRANKGIPLDVQNRI